MQKGADPNRMSQDGDLAFIEAILSNENAALVLINKAPNCDVNVVEPYDGETPLMVAAYRGRVEVLKALLAKGADPLAVNNEGKTALGMAMAQGQKECTAELQKALLAKEGDADAVSAETQAAFEAAIRRGDEASALTLLDQGASWRRKMRIRGEELSVLGAAARLDRGRVVKAIVQRMRADGVGAEKMAKCLEAAAYHASVSGALNSQQALVEEGLAVKGEHVEEDLTQRTASKRKR